MPARKGSHSISLHVVSCFSVPCSGAEWNAGILRCAATAVLLTETCNVGRMCWASDSRQKGACRYSWMDLLMWLWGPEWRYMAVELLCCPPKCQAPRIILKGVCAAA